MTQPNNPFHPYHPPKLTIELVPAPLWTFNLRKLFTKQKWDETRAACYKRAGHTCEICGDLKGKPPEAHEIWEYDDLRRIQKLHGLISLCSQCHKVKHIGFALTQGHAAFGRAVNHLAKVNDWPYNLAAEYIDRQFQIHELRSELSWTQDLSWIDDIDVYIAESEAIARKRHGQLVTATLEKMRSRDADE